MLKNILNKYTEEQGESLGRNEHRFQALLAMFQGCQICHCPRSIPHIHMHPLFFETGLKCHQCDICSDQMKVRTAASDATKTPEIATDDHPMSYVIC